MDKVRIGIIGVGNMGSAHIMNVQNVPEAVLAAICDRDRERADRMAKKAPKDCRVFYSVDDLLNSGTVDAVIISVPHYDHVREGDSRAVREAGCRDQESRAEDDRRTCETSRAAVCADVQSAYATGA